MAPPWNVSFHEAVAYGIHKQSEKTAFDLFDQEGLRVFSAHTQEGTSLPLLLCDSNLICATSNALFIIQGEPQKSCWSFRDYHCAGTCRTDQVRTSSDHNLVSLKAQAGSDYLSHTTTTRYQVLLLNKWEVPLIKERNVHLSKRFFPYTSTFPLNLLYV